MKLQDIVKLKPIIDAIEQGKTIQALGNLGTKWMDVDTQGIDIAWLLSDMTIHPEVYRIKPEPREWYELDTCAVSLTNVHYCMVYQYDTLDAAMKHHPYLQAHNFKKVREVIE